MRGFNGIFLYRENLQGIKGAPACAVADFLDDYQDLKDCERQGKPESGSAAG